MWGAKNTPLQNRTNVQIKGGGGAKGLLNNVQKKITFPPGWLPLYSNLKAKLFQQLAKVVAGFYQL